MRNAKGPYVVSSPSAICICGPTVAHQAVRPKPVDVLDRAAGLLGHDIPEAVVV
jgi:hypothetical protein